MKNIQLLDCTMRDGGYVVDTRFGKSNIAHIIDTLVQARVEIIECGFLRNESGGDDSTEFALPNELKPYLPQKQDKSQFVLMYDVGKYDVGRLPENEGILCGIRICFHKDFVGQAFKEAAIIKAKGYEAFIQPTGILNYDTREILDLLDKTNEIGAKSFSIVDTFGSMSKRDLQRIYLLVDTNLSKNICIGFHSHNNLQMAFSLSQDFIEMNDGIRNIIVDSTVYGMGRGAGNTNTECIAAYLNTYCGKSYDVNIILDLIEERILSIYAKAPWGYNIRNFVSGINSSHVNNTAYLYNKGTLSSKDIKAILENIPQKDRAHFDRGHLEEATAGYMARLVNDTQDIERLRLDLAGKEVVVICPGKSIIENSVEIENLCKNSGAVKIAVNFVPSDFNIDYLFFSNTQRFQKWQKEITAGGRKVVVTSNIIYDGAYARMNYEALISKGWQFFDNAGMMCLRMLDKAEAGQIYIAGMDGYYCSEINYYNNEYNVCREAEIAARMNYEIGAQLKLFVSNMVGKRKVTFITKSLYEEVMM